MEEISIKNGAKKKLSDVQEIIGSFQPIPWP